ncbi:ATPase [Paenibacillus sp. SYP-B3998]|uniref:ATPase n=1 Tax=Paenibacillus sp. SYP-B3998 TaxID=2678564 RepID=A0A6G3ZTK0_9BACL|nr:ATPase [Paenibacillus sp. SYP-B3998]
MPYVLGIDGGGTQTSCAFQRIDDDERGVQQTTSALIGEGSNPLSVGFDTMKHRIRALIKQAMIVHDIQPSDILGVCAGIAGTRLETNRISVECELKQIGHDLKFHEEVVYNVKSDLYIALRGAMHPTDQEGTLVISGTGSNAIRLSKQGQLFTNGGWGHLLGDEGSGYHIGLEALKTVCRVSDLREGPTQLTPMVLEALKLSSEHDLITYMYQVKPEKKDIASLAKLVIEASRQSDASAVRILQEAGDHLVELVKGLQRKSEGFHEETPITVSGSIFTYSEVVKRRFKEGLRTHKLGNYQEPYGDPVYGALRVAVDALRAKGRC